MSKPSNLRIEDTTAATARADLNDILISIASLQTTDGDGAAYTGEPTTTYPNMLWYDKATSILKLRTTADDAWVNVAYVDQSSNEFRILDDTKVVNTSNTQTGLLGDQSTATWEAGVGTTESLISPVKLKAAINSADGSAKSWVNFNQNGTHTERDSFNVSSLTDNGTAVTTVNITNSFASADHTPTVSGPAGNGRYACLALSSRLINTKDVSISSSSWTVGFLNPTAGYDYEPNYMMTSSHGDLA